MDKLHATEKEVAQLQKDLTVMKPDLELAQHNAGEMLKIIEKDRAKAQETKTAVEKEEEEATEKANITQDIAADAQKDLDEAMPALMAAEESLKALNKNDISEVRTMKKPPPGVHLVMETICIVKDVKPLKEQGPTFGQKILNYWDPGRNLLQNPDQFLTSLMEFDKESITAEMIEKLDPYIKNPDFTPKKIKKVSKACTSLCMWVHAMYKYYFINLAVAPKKAAYAEAKAALEETEKSLAAAKERMRLIMENLQKLENTLKATEEKREKLQASMQLCLDRMDRATRLIGGLADERTIWIETIAILKDAKINIVGDILICSAAVAYLGPFIDSYRQTLLQKWRDMLKSENVPYSPNCGPVPILGEPVLIRQWQLFGLPRDNFSVENAVMIMNSSRWPLFIDPQGQANRWLKSMCKEDGISVVKPADKTLMRTLETCVRFGKTALIENMGQEIDPALDSILLRQIFKQGGQNVIKIGDSVVPYNETFHLYITTKLPNPHFTPETAIKVLVVNFTLVPSGLQDQLLATVVSQERADLEEARSAIIVSSAQMRQELKECEDHILERLSSSTGSPVDDVELIETLEASKSKSEEIKLKVAAAEVTQRDIDTTRKLYVPVATRGQILFFCLADLCNIDPMYQYSLEWFMNIFVGSMVNTEKTDNINERIHNVNENLTFSLYSNVCRSLFARHKFQFAFLMCVRILMDCGYIDHNEWQFLLAGGSPLHDHPNPAPSWLSQRPWQDLLSLENLPNYQPFVKSFIKNPSPYKRLLDSQSPHTEPLPEPWDTEFTDFQFLLILKCMRADKVTNAMQIFIAKHLGDRFIEPQTIDLQSMYDDSSPSNPLVFVLSPGTDPAAEIYKFAEKKRFAKKMYSISLGQGQGPRAEAMLMSALETGFWVFFQNCHLAPSWMPSLEQLIENISDSANKDFRVWLTSTPSPFFPVSILQNSSKVTVEPPKGLKANLLRAYTNQITEFLTFLKSEDPKVPNFKLLLFSLCLFHGICLERRKFGPLGFNIAYEFTDGDLRICISQLNMFLLEYDTIPFKVLLYTAGQINYGGRVTDDWDRRCIMNILQDYYRAEVLQEQFDFFGNRIYHQIPTSSEVEDYLDYIRTLPLNDDPFLFGMHENADISYAQNETSTFLKTLLALQPRVAGGAAQNQEEVTSNLAKSIMNEIPDVFDVKSIAQKYPVLYKESLNTVLVQEIMRFNRLLKIIHESLGDLLKAIKGLVVMSGEFEAMAASLFTNRVPTMWAARAYPSLKPLGPWVADLKARITFLNNWIDKGIPPVFWISGFYFPQAFLTGTMQNFARRNVVSIDIVDFGFKVLNDRPSKGPTSGCYIYGFFLEGCRWGYNEGRLVESRPKELYTDMPVIWLIPQANKVPATEGVYVCPVYKTLTRAGTLSTTGHSTNFVTAIELPSNEPQKHWIQRGVALICALDY